MTALARAGARDPAAARPCAAVALVGDVGAAADPAGEGGRAAAVARARAAKLRPRLAALGGAAFLMSTATRRCSERCVPKQKQQKQSPYY